ncbi:MAG: (2Fe-2S)-binding protein [Chloroflexi bacterium]|nr:(2Fe-2S)-binding protein [Chloroflexota bacterium]
MKSIKLEINGVQHEVEVAPWRTLLEVIREELQMTGTKEGCGLGECGACSVLMDGKTVNSCLVLAAEANGKRITTIEGLAQAERLHPIQQSFIDNGGFQCGFCTPGMIMSTKVMLDDNPNPTDDEIKKGISGNLCRCTGYAKIFDSIRAAKVAMAASSDGRGGA